MKMNKKILILILAMIFLFPIVVSVGDSVIETGIRFTGQQNKVLSIHDTCTVDGFVCGPTFTCEFTILNPDQSILVNNVSTTKVIELYTYNLSSDQTEDIGKYRVTSYCSNVTDAGRLIFFYEITPSGFSQTTSSSISSFIIMLVMFGIIILICYFIIALPYQNIRNEEGTVIAINKLKYVRLILIGFLYPTVVITLNLMNGIAVNFIYLSMFSGTIGFLFEVLIRLIWPFSVIMVMLFIYLMVRDTNFRKLMKMEAYSD